MKKEGIKKKTIDAVPSVVAIGKSYSRIQQKIQKQTAVGEG
jgi:hypothetical protein